MPNYCDYCISVTGRTDNVNEFINIIQAKDYTTKHFYRVFEANVCTIDNYGLLSKALIDGYCAWSVYCCMFPGAFSYYSENEDYYLKNKEEVDKDPDWLNRIQMGTNILIEAQRLALRVEVYSQEPGMAFQEHYKIINGSITLDEPGEYEEWYIGDYDDYDQFMNDMFSTDEARQKCKLTREEFERAKNLRQDVVEFSDYYPEDCDSLDIIPKRLTKDIMYTLVKETVDKNSKKG